MDSLEFLLVLSAIVLFSALLYQSRSAQFRARLFLMKSAIGFGPCSGATWMVAPLKPLKRSRRPIRWISLEEFEGILNENPEDLLVLDLRADARWAPFPVPNADVLPVRPDELPGILAWLPSSQRVVFYGVRDPWISAIEKSPSMAGCTPAFLLDDSFEPFKAA